MFFLPSFLFSRKSKSNLKYYSHCQDHKEAPELDLVERLVADREEQWCTKYQNA
jgi:hypothetical protein